MGKEIKVTIPWESADKTGKAVFEVQINTILDAIRANSHNYNELENIRKDLVCLTMQVENLQYTLKKAA